MRFLSAFLLFIFTSHGVSANDSIKVKVEKAAVWEEGESQTVFCEVSTPMTYDVSSHAEAELVWVALEGKVVKKGDQVSIQDDYYLKNQLDILNISIANAISNYEFAEEEYQRLKSLSAETFVAISQLNEQKKLSEESRYMYERLSKEREALEHRIGKLVLTSPVDGTVGLVDVKLGENIDVGRKIVEVIPDSTKELKCKLPVTDLVALRSQVGGVEKAAFKLKDNIPVRYLRQKNLVNSIDQTVDVFLEIPNEYQANYVDGERTTVEFMSDNDGIVKIPTDAVVIKPEGSFAWVVQANSQVKKYAVEVLSSDPKDFIVRSDIEVGMPVVIRGKQNLSDGAVTFVEE
ncbi:efflux RND transporter periplasmic adaptor subunit [Pseudoalteromonas luteoviolacea]|uniref:Multidrug resistance protein MdtA-like C-terminal permuted SH3 domain-containing protein n=1 Tax=Pseudoalteromonas luteoviolacea S4060-1 TaxID=1365257 RepID=A0A162BA67_9GAMM|nr:efflux RND transporter periplasmic adaptor subunit [Pseudoalteromonas luteoviolacea]KZN69015.1 hypothetical protein N478_12595 [Pseudoalteromonas luteoviolacea S4060-1]